MKIGDLLPFLIFESFYPFYTLELKSLKVNCKLQAGTLETRNWKLQSGDEI